MYAEKYLGYSNGEKVYLPGRLLKDPIILPKESSTGWQPVVNNIRRFLSREIKKTTFLCILGGKQYNTKTDQEGYYIIEEAHHSPRKSYMFTETADILLDKRIEKHEYVIPARNPEYGIISDIDDTILKTEVLSTFRMLYLSFTKTPWKREAIEHAVDSFQKLTQQGRNPIFYVSHSPWNIYGNIQKFLELSGFPKGPILLRDYGLYLRKKPETYTQHKLLSIRKILAYFPDLPFILIGDGAEKDPAFYTRISDEFPGRIKKIYIRQGEGMHQDLSRYQNYDNFEIIKSFEGLLS